MTDAGSSGLTSREPAVLLLGAGTQSRAGLPAAPAPRVDVAPRASTAKKRAPISQTWALCTQHASQSSKLTSTESLAAPLS